MSTEVLLTSDGVELALHNHGGSGPVVLLVHGASLCSAVLEPLAQSLAPIGRVIAPDLRGHGRSSRPVDGNFSWDRFGEDLVELLDVLDEPVLAFGHSLGATALLLASARRPGSIRSLCCFEPIVIFDDAGRAGALEQVARTRRRITSFESRNAAFERLSGRPPFDQVLPAALEGYLDDGFVEHADGSISLVLEPADEAAIYEGAVTAHLDEELRRVGCAPTFLVGARSEGPGVTGTHRLAAMTADAALLELAGVGHFGPLEDPDAVAVVASTTFDIPDA